MREDDKHVSSTGEEASIWTLTNEWMARIEKAYGEYTAASWGLFSFIALGATGLTALIFGISIMLEFVKSTTSADSLFKKEVIGVIAIFFIAIAVIGGCIVVIKRMRQLELLKQELGDLLSISQELFEMVISSEDKQTSSRYQYLVNHVRILEIKHLLRKVRRAVGKD
jgi:hypothetical protein